MANEFLKRQLSTDSKPYVMFLRTENEHFGEDQGERKDVEWRCDLADSRGGLHVWVGLSQISFYVKKGWKIIGYGNFESYANNKQILEIADYVRDMTDAYQQVKAARAELKSVRKAA